MTRGIVLLFGVLLLPISAIARQTCQQTLSSLTVAEETYQAVTASAFAGRLYLWVPEIRSSIGGTFKPFQVWLLEGVYGKPFSRSSGHLDQSGFDQLRKSTNVRVTGFSVSGAKRQTFTFGRQSYGLEVTRVNASPWGTDSVALKICR